MEWMRRPVKDWNERTEWRELNWNDLHPSPHPVPICSSLTSTFWCFVHLVTASALPLETLDVLVPAYGMNICIVLFTLKPFNSEAVERITRPSRELGATPLMSRELGNIMGNKGFPWQHISLNGMSRKIIDWDITLESSNKNKKKRKYKTIMMLEEFTLCNTHSF